MDYRVGTIFKRSQMGYDKIFIVLILIFIFLFGCNKPFAEESLEWNLKIGTASEEGNYYPLGQSIKFVLDSLDSPLNLEVIQTQGSVDNIERLSRNEIDLAIVQNDIAFFAENGIDPFDDEVTNLAGISSFYSEPIYLLTNDLSISHPSQLVNKEINIGPIGSGLYTDAKIILNSLELWSSITVQTESPDDGIDALLAGEIDTAFINAIPERHKQAILNGELKLIPVKASTISRISNTYPYFTTFESDEVGVVNTTIAVRAILIGRDDLKEEIVNELAKIIHENIHLLKLPIYTTSIVPEQLVQAMSLNSFHAGAEIYYQKIDLLQSQKLLKVVGISLLIIACLVILIFISNIFLLPRFISDSRFLSTNSKILRFVKWSHQYVTNHKYLMVLFFMVTGYITIIILVQIVEHNWAIQNNAISNFDNRSFGRNLLWIFIFGGSGYEDNLFPNSPLAKFLVTLIPLIGIGGFLALAGLFTSDHIKNRLLRARGVKSNMVKNHIILCGWNDNVPFLIDNLLHESIVKKKPIVLLADLDEDMPLEANNIDKDLVTYVRGKATKKNDLRRANIQEADIAIIVGDSRSTESDAKSILKILTIEKYCKELEAAGKRDGRKNIYTIAEIQDTDNFDSAYDADVDEIISLGHIKSKIFVHSILNPGVSNFINEIMTYNEFNDIYSIVVDKKSRLTGHTFDDLLVKLRKEKILLLAISIGNHKSRRELSEIKQKFQLERTVLTNPISEKEINYKTQIEDTLIVLAENEDVVRNTIKEWEV